MKLDEIIMKSIINGVLGIAKRNHFDVFGIFPYGSINYNLFTENSDVDFIVPVIPSIYDLATFRKYTEAFDHTVSGIKITVKFIDFRELH